MEVEERFKKESVGFFFFAFENEILGKMCTMVARLFCM